MLIENIRLENLQEKARLVVDINSEKLGRDELWFSIPSTYSNYLTIDRYDSFLVGMLYPAIIYGEDIYISGCVSEKLLYNINNYIIPLINVFSPGSCIIKVKADSVISKSFFGIEIGAGFSGGVDSFCTIVDHYKEEKNINYRITKLLLLNVGSHGPYDDVKTTQKFLNRYKYLSSFPNEEKLEFIPIDSNLHKFHIWGHQMTHTLTAVAGVLNFQKIFQKYYFSSGISYKDIPKSMIKYQNHDIGAFSDPILLPLLSTESLQFFPDGQQYTRSDKIKRIANYKPANKLLNVCIKSSTDSYINCSVCSKCMRTINVLESLDLLENFSEVFNYELYQKKRLAYMAKLKIAYNKSPFAKENIDLAKMRHKYIPNILLSILINYLSILKSIIKRLFDNFLR